MMCTMKTTLTENCSNAWERYAASAIKAGFAIDSGSGSLIPPSIQKLRSLSLSKDTILALYAGAMRLRSELASLSLVKPASLEPPLLNSLPEDHHHLVSGFTNPCNNVLHVHHAVFSATRSGSYSSGRI